MGAADAGEIRDFVKATVVAVVGVVSRFGNRSGVVGAEGVVAAGCVRREGVGDRLLCHRLLLSISQAESLMLQTFLIV